MKKKKILIQNWKNENIINYLKFGSVTMSKVDEGELTIFSSPLEVKIKEKHFTMSFIAVGRHKSYWGALYLHFSWTFVQGAVKVEEIFSTIDCRWVIE